MKRTLVSLLTLLTLSGLSVFTSCQKDTPGDGTQFRATMEPAADGKTVLSGTALNWVEGDQVAIYGTAGRGLYTAIPQTPATIATLNNVSGETGDGPFRAFYPASLTTDGVTITLPAAQTYVEGSINEFPMYAESATNQLAFKNLCGVLKLHLTKANTNISNIEIVTNSIANGVFSVSFSNGEPALVPVSGGTYSVVLTCQSPQDISEGADFFIYLPATVDSIKSIIITSNDNRYCRKVVKQTSHITISRSRYTTVTFDENDLVFCPIGSEGGLFTINSEGDQVWFSQGNLQYQASTNTWRFAEHQYDIVGNGNNYISPTYTGWIDVFGWGTGNNPTNTSNNDADYGVFVDWGSNPISNGGNVPNQWRTLTSSEWNYIIFDRSNALAKKGACQINGVNGVILLSDNFVLPSGCSFNPGFGHGWTYNTYTIEQWELMEEAGAFFFPAAGQYRYYNYGNIGITVRYWTSTMTQPYNADRLWSDSAEGLSANPGSGWFNHSRFSVRLARDND